MDFNQTIPTEILWSDSFSKLVKRPPSARRYSPRQENAVIGEQVFRVIAVPYCGK